MKFKTTITGRSLSEPFEAVVNATDEYDARIKALRRFYNNRQICSFMASCPFPGQDPSGQSGYGYEKAPAKSGCDLASATPLVRVCMEPC